ncbi:MAG TPA: nuclear transport factor 2 family protein [Acidimicrobiales bacterium]|nr:nuclear transport factor 2 family protein [Acidimicrobiales bacterium]
MTALEAEVGALRAALGDIGDERAIEALMVSYHVACDHPTDKGNQVAALFTEDGRWESVGAHGNPAWAAVGREALIPKFDRNHERMPFAVHHLTGGRIVLAGDGAAATRTARGDWTYFQACTYRGTTPLWISGAYHVAFRREPSVAGGRWLITHLQVENHFTTPFDRGWVEVPHVATP